MTSLELKNAVCKVLSDKKAIDIKSIKVGDLTVVADYFVVCTGRSSTQIKALAEEVEEVLEKEYGERIIRSEGVKDGQWAVVDYGNVMVHIFNSEARENFSLEKLWNNGDNVEIFEEE